MAILHAVQSTILAALLPIQFTLHFCEPGTHCSDCMETIPLSATVDLAAGSVRMAGRGTAGRRLIEPLTNCVVADRENWSCEHHSRIEAKAGVITVTVGKRWADSIEACTTQER